MELRHLMVVALLTAFATGQISSLQNGDSSSDVVANLELSPALDIIHASWRLLNATGNVDNFIITWTHELLDPRQCNVGLPATNSLNCGDAAWYPLYPCMEYIVTVQPQTIANIPIGVNASAKSYTLTKPPDAPTLVTCSLSGSLVTVTWTAPKTDCDIVSNTVSWEGDVLWSDGQDDDEYTAGATDSSFTLPHTVPYTRYTVSVAATVAEGVKGAAGTCKDQMVTPEEAPSAPQNLHFTVVRSRAIEVTWQPPDRINGLLRSYSVECGAGNATERKDVEDDTLTYMIRGLEEQTNYTISVTAVTAMAGAPAEAVVRTAAITSPDMWAFIAIIVIGMVVGALLKRDLKRAKEG